MHFIRTLLSSGPKVSKDHPTDNVSEDLSDVALDKPVERFQHFLRHLRIYTLGTANEEITRPVISSYDIFWILVNLHINIRFITQYIDLCLEWGGRKYNASAKKC